MSDPERAEQVVTVPRRRRRASRRSSARSRTRLRSTYFGLASLWGFLTGSGAVLLGLAIAGRPVELGLGTDVLLIGGGAVALLGGLVAAAAYREASRRQR
jgi:hypothetical protein